MSHEFSSTTVFECIPSRRNFLFQQKYFLLYFEARCGQKNDIFPAPAVEILARNWDDECQKSHLGLGLRRIGPAPRTSTRCYFFPRNISVFVVFALNRPLYPTKSVRADFSSTRCCKFCGERLRNRVNQTVAIDLSLRSFLTTLF